MTRKSRKRPEDVVQRSIFQYLKNARRAVTKPFIALHVPNGGKRSKIEASIMVGLGVRAGAADIVLSWTDGSAWVEVKAPGGRLRKSQREFCAECAEKSIPFHVVESVDDFENVLLQLQLIRRPLLKRAAERN